MPRSKSKQFRRWWRRTLFRILLQAATWCGRPGSRRLRVLSRVGGWLDYYLRPSASRLDEANLGIALGRDCTLGERRRILRRSLTVSATTALQMLQMISRPSSARTYSADFQARGTEYLDAALALGKGVIGISAHLGNFAAGPMWLADQGYPITMVIREAKHVPPGLYKQCFEVFGIDAVVVDSDRGATMALIRALKAGRIVMIYIDQDAKKGGTEVYFLGKTTPIPEGPAVLARRTGAAIVPVFCHGTSSENTTVEILAALEISALEGRAGIEQDIRAMANLAEQRILQYPEQWGWRYRRWRNRVPAILQ